MRTAQCDIFNRVLGHLHSRKAEKALYVIVIFQVWPLHFTMVDQFFVRTVKGLAK